MRFTLRELFMLVTLAAVLLAVIRVFVYDTVYEMMCLYVSTYGQPDNW
jgi:hypothetical protein